ncbi:MAG: nucleotidyltransferase domain-containing protein [Solirubrobacterales bacterium]
MEFSEVVAILDDLELSDVRYWLAGGWAIDALAGSQTRPHRDLDVLVCSSDLATVEAVLALRGYQRADESELPAFLILRNGREQQVDLYLVAFDSVGHCWQSYSPRRWDYFSADDLAGRGRVRNRELPCLSPDAQFRQFLGYEWGESALHDLGVLHQVCGRPLPPGVGESLPSA